MTVRELRNQIEQRKGKRDQTLQQIKNISERLDNSRLALRHHEEAKEIIKQVSIKTQQQLQYHVSDIVSSAVSAVYDDPYSLIAEFIQRRNKTECDLFFERNGKRIDPLSAAGGGVVNIATFALRVALWSIQRPRSNNILMLDEPFGNVSSDLLPRASEMLKQISAKLKLQILMVTHAHELMEDADKIFVAQLRKGVTEIKEE